MYIALLIINIITLIMATYIAYEMYMTEKRYNEILEQNVSIINHVKSVLETNAEIIDIAQKIIHEEEAKLEP